MAMANRPNLKQTRFYAVLMVPAGTGHLA